MTKWAWNLNLPLPPRAKFVFLGRNLCGHTAMVKFLRACGLKLVSDHLAMNDAHFHYIENYKLLTRFENCAINATVNGTNLNQMDDFAKLFLTTIAQHTPILALVRDPLEILCTFSKPGGGHYCIQKSRQFRVDLPYLCPISYRTDKKTRILEILTSNYAIFSLGFTLNLLKRYGFSNLHFIDMSAIKKERAYATMLDLSARFNFTHPANLSIFSKTIFNPTPAIPQHCYLPCTQGLMKTYLSVKKNRKLLNLATNLQIPMPDSKIPLFWGIAPKDFEILKNDANLNAIKAHCARFISAVYEGFLAFERDTLSPKDILEILAEDAALRVRFWQITQWDLKEFSQICPQIVESWQHYQAFLKLCANLDKNVESQTLHAQQIV